MKSLEASPVSFLVSVARLPQKGMPVTIEANADQRAVLASEHGLNAVERFHAELLVESWKSEGVRVTGRVEAEIEQACIVTLEPIEAEIDEEVEALFVPEHSKLVKPHVDERGEILLASEGADAPEVFSGDQIDIGALAEEFFALGIDPYPRKPGAVLERPEEKRAEESPFAKLTALKKK
jgi:uncharacterized metal-binding protein YceD (DUF177 family)